MVTGTKPVTASRSGSRAAGETSDSFTYEAVSDSGNRVLVVAAEDYTGASPVQTGGPNYVNYYLDALQANGVRADVYDVDARGRIAPTTSASSATTTASSGTRATTSSRASQAGRGTPTGSRSTSCSSSGPT